MILTALIADLSRQDRLDSVLSAEVPVVACTLRFADFAESH